MSSHTVNDLVGLSFYASIGEPWDFESDAGPNKLLGTIQQIAFDQSGNPLLLCEVVPFSFSKSRIHQVVAVNRYRGSQDVIDAMRTKGAATLNFMFQKSGHALPEISMNAALSAFSDTANCSFLVGTMHLQQRSQIPSADPAKQG